MKHRRRYLSAKEKAKLIHEQKGLCRCGCGEPLGTDPSLIAFDHMCDLQFGGGNEWENWAALRPKHHMAKTIRAAKARAKCDRIAKRDGLRKRRLSEADKALARMLGTTSNIRREK